jgi:AraC-like DNA-binding protein
VVFAGAASMNESPQAPVQPRPRVLLVDDDKPTRATLAAALTPASDVVEADSAASALAVLAGMEGTFDVVMVCCLRSRPAPHYDGAIELVREIFRRSPALSVLVLSDPDEAERLEADLLLSGVRGVIPTPLVAASVAEAVQRVVRQHPVRRPASPQNVAAIRRILEFLDQHVGDVPTLAELAAMAGMSRSHFSRTFHTVVGMSLRDYVRDLRLKRAHGLLVGGKLSLTNIAVESGFYDLPHFDKAFRHRLGISPHQFRTRYATPA